MTVLYFLIGALAVLLSLLLCGFVGCNWVFGLEETSLIPPMEGNYPDVVKGEAKSSRLLAAGGAVPRRRCPAAAVQPKTNWEILTVTTSN